jgi:hypothetical protein
LEIFTESYSYPKVELMLSTERRAPLTCGTDNSWGDFEASRAETAAGVPNFSHAYATRGGPVRPVRLNTGIGNVMGQR